VGAIVYLARTLSFADPATYRYGLVAVAGLAGVVILGLGLWPPTRPRPEWALTNYIGLRSYSIYLFHWPLVIVLTEWAGRTQATQAHPALWAGWAAIPLTFAAAELSYRLIEQPFRARRRPAARLGAEPNPGPAGRARLRRRWPVRLVGAVGALALGALSARAVATAPVVSSIEADLRHGAMTLDAAALRDLAGGLAELAARLDPLGPADGGGP
jgi:peptidoglycan/LPS O-acetylase OafA/YrhL